MRRVVWPAGLPDFCWATVSPVTIVGGDVSTWKWYRPPGSPGTGPAVQSATSTSVMSTKASAPATGAHALDEHESETGIVNSRPLSVGPQPGPRIAQSTVYEPSALWTVNICVCCPERVRYDPWTTGEASCRFEDRLKVTLTPRTGTVLFRSKSTGTTTTVCVVDSDVVAGIDATTTSPPFGEKSWMSSSWPESVREKRKLVPVIVSTAPLEGGVALWPTTTMSSPVTCCPPTRNTRESRNATCSGTWPLVIADEKSDSRGALTSVVTTFSFFLRSHPMFEGRPALATALWGVPPDGAGTAAVPPVVRAGGAATG